MICLLFVTTTLTVNFAPVAILEEAGLSPYAPTLAVLIGLKMDMIQILMIHWPAKD